MIPFTKKGFDNRWTGGGGGGKNWPGQLVKRAIGRGLMHGMQG